MMTPGRDEAGAEPQGRGPEASGDGARRPGWAAASLLVIAACAAGLGFAAGSRAAMASDAASVAGPGESQEVEAGCAVLPPGHPSLGEGLRLPPGHPPVGDELLPPGHPPVGAFPHLPAGHPPLPAVPAPILLLEPPASFSI